MFAVEPIKVMTFSFIFDTWWVYEIFQKTPSFP